MCLNAQIKESVSLGFVWEISLPVGKFSEKDVNPNYAGLATQGYSFNGHIGIRLSEYIGIELKGLYAEWAVDPKPVANGPEVAIPIAPGLAHRRWKTYAGVAGIYSQLALNRTNTISWIYNLQGGCALVTLPLIYNPGYFGSGEFARPERKTFSPAFLAGTGFRFDVGNLILTIHGSYFMATPRFRRVPIKTLGGTKYSNVTYPITAFNAGFALGFSTAKKHGKKQHRYLG